MDSLLEIKNLRVNFDLNGKLFPAVSGVNLEVAKNQVLVLAGESGSGKTITALSVARILPKTARIVSGEINFNGQDLLKLQEKDMIKIRGREIAYVFQEPTSFLNPVFTVGYQIIETIIQHQKKTKRQAREEALELLRKVQINHPEKTITCYPHQLSGGMNQRVFIAMGLACKPKLLIADEPTTSLDVTIEKAILKLLMDLKNSLGFSLLLITHNLSIAKMIADKICIMYQGKIVEKGDRQNIFNSPEHPHTKELIKAYEKIGRI